MMEALRRFWRWLTVQHIAVRVTIPIAVCVLLVWVAIRTSLVVVAISGAGGFLAAWAARRGHGAVIRHTEASEEAYPAGEQIDRAEHAGREARDRSGEVAKTDLTSEGYRLRSPLDE